MLGNDFSFYRLLSDLKEERASVKTWEEFEQLIAQLCRRQDPGAVYQAGKYPDVVLSDGFGIEAKFITKNPYRTINLNSSMPSETCYICAYHNGEEIEHAGAIDGRNFYTEEVEKIGQLHKPTVQAQNPLIKYRVRLMVEIESPFKIWRHGFFVVDRAGGIVTL